MKDKMTVSSVPLELPFQLMGQMANKKMKDAVRLLCDSHCRGHKTREGSGLRGGVSWESVIFFEKSTLGLPWRGGGSGQTSGQEKMKSL